MATVVIWACTWRLFPACSWSHFEFCICLLAVCGAHGRQSGVQLYEVVLCTVMGAPLSFFVQTDTGVTINRCS
ncbi:hypothetical protein B0O99DRAFT_23625 [Bisporella sp. PMI_857]|nr:hypothetical protein B0O99DRAFT_23625 [Bisporella sp. PMI_857]